MEWIWFAIARVFFVTGNKVGMKLSLSSKLPSVTISAFYGTFISTVILIPYILWDGSWRSIENTQFLVAVAGNVAFNTVGHLLMLTVVRKFDISYVAALTATSPLIFGLFSFIFLGEGVPTQVLLFMILIALGGIFVELSRAKFEGFVKFVKESAWLPVLLFLCISAGAMVFSKLGVTHGDPEAYIACRYLCLSIVFFTLHHLYESKRVAKLLKRTRGPIKMRFDARAATAGLFMMGSVICEMNALQYTSIANVEALSKLSIVTILIADALFISKNVTTKRWLGALLIVIGSMGVALLS